MVENPGSAGNAANPADPADPANRANPVNPVNPVNRAYPALTYRDPRVAVDFLEKAFGFEQRHVYEGEDGGIVHAELRLGDAWILLGPAAESGPMGGLGPAAVYVVVADPDAHHTRAVETGAEIVMPLSDMDYGSREYAAKDPEGNLWSFGTYRPGV
ncbi:VOC family protein [Streptomyces cacaoi]